MTHLSWVKCSLQQTKHDTPAWFHKKKKKKSDIPVSSLRVDSSSHLSLSLAFPWKLNLKSSRARELLLLECYQELSHCSKCVMFLNWEDKGIKILYFLESSLGNSPESWKVWLGGGEKPAVISGRYLHRPAHCPPTFHSVIFAFMHSCIFIHLIVCSLINISWAPIMCQTSSQVMGSLR